MRAGRGPGAAIDPPDIDPPNEERAPFPARVFVLGAPRGHRSRVAGARLRQPPRVSYDRFLKKSALIWMYCFHSAGRSSCG